MTKRKLACSILIQEYPDDPDALIADIRNKLKEFKYNAHKRAKGKNHQILIESEDKSEARNIYEALCNENIDKVNPVRLGDRIGL